MTALHSSSALFVALLVALALCAIPTPASAQVYLLWPQPQDISEGSDIVQLDPSSFAFNSTCASSPILDAAYARYRSFIFGYTTCNRVPTTRTPSSSSSSSSSASDAQGFSAQARMASSQNPMVSLSVCVASASEPLQLGVDESYTLSVDDTNPTLAAKTVYGALHGLETFFQLVRCSSSSGFFIESTPLVITDAPRFPWRGLLIDTARHYLPVSTILDTIDALVYVKMNTLHWHAVDAQSFPIESTSLPNITLGAWQPSLVYAATDIANVVQYGAARGVRVVVEFDTPGHAASWGVGYPSLTVTDCPSYTHNINNIPLNPTKQATYDMMHNFFAEMSGLFPDSHMHFGGDEVVYGCWGQDAGVTSFMRQHGFSYDQLLNYYFQQLWQPLGTWSKTPVVWQEVFLANVALPTGAVVHIWEDPSSGDLTIEDVVDAGVHGLVSPGWYLDHLDQTWQDMYAIDPLTNCTAATGGSASSPALSTEKRTDCFNITDPTRVARVLGGEAAMWGEQVDQTNLESRVWPRAAAVAERLWSAASVNDPTAALQRLLAHRCRMVRRGVDVAPLQPGYC